ncbi:uncharacterized protein LOC117344756 [Pecten maximus]|uniref:uncharacterized protein LOC117344756 n=1 Tax=Pecten maximus TaxID=6579 RepID=UPI001458017A|nr:uncharacterized protein LOC117344756 [Pecten maximus]
MWKLFPGVCRLDGYTYDPIFGVCIHLYTTALIWDKAVEACSNDSAYLLILDTVEKVQATKTGVHKERFAESHHWWLGGYDYDDGPANDFRWSNDATIFGNTIENSKWKKTFTGTNFVYNDGVVFSQQTSGSISCAQACQLHTTTCVEFSYAITTKECRGYNGLSQNPVSQANANIWTFACRLDGYTYDPALRVCIRLYTVTKTWQDAADACSAETAQLLILDTVQKLQATTTGVHKDLFAAGGIWWIGGYDNDAGPANDFKWGNGQIIDANLFSPIQPDNDHERCIHLNSEPGLNDFSCSSALFYVCQKNI